MERKPDDPLAPETVNREQEDEAQNLGVDRSALSGDRGEVPLSERGNPTSPSELLPDDTPDLVERMEAMTRSGRIDNDAFAGEPSHDDEPDILGEDARRELEGDGPDATG